jgi:hypothetical protein
MRVTPASCDAQPDYLRGPNRNYHRFIVLGHQRSGSSLVVNTLKKHPAIVSFGEVLYSEGTHFNVKGYDDNSLNSLRFRNNNPIEFLDGFVFCGYRDDIEAVGFKAFPDQIDNFRCRRIWTWLEQNTDLKIIQLARQDLFATYTSLLIAYKDNRFSIKDESERSKRTIYIHPHRCMAEFKQRANYDKRTKASIEHHDVMKITYEELAVHPSLYLKNIQKFIGVRSHDLQITMVRQEIRTLSEVIENYDDLRRHFLGTEWEHLFD